MVRILNPKSLQVGAREPGTQSSDKETTDGPVAGVLRWVHDKAGCASVGKMVNWIHLPQLKETATTRVGNP